jgi:hypothetical protein
MVPPIVPVLVPPETEKATAIRRQASCRRRHAPGRGVIPNRQPRIDTAITEVAVDTGPATVGPGNVTGEPSIMAVMVAGSPGPGQDRGIRPVSMIDRNTDRSGAAPTGQAEQDGRPPPK